MRQMGVCEGLPPCTGRRAPPCAGRLRPASLCPGAGGCPTGRSTRPRQSPPQKTRLSREVGRQQNMTDYDHLPNLIMQNLGIPLKTALPLIHQQ